MNEMWTDLNSSSVPALARALSGMVSRSMLHLFVVKRLLCVNMIAAMALTVWCASTGAQTTTNYDALIQQGKTQLQAGSAEQALSSGHSAIKLNAVRWEGYALTGGALMNLKRYEEAADTLSESIKRAPEAKQQVLRDLRRQCLQTSSATAVAETQRANLTTQAEIVLWKSIENSTNLSDFQSYLEQYPEGAFAVLARRHLTEAKTAVTTETEQSLVTIPAGSFMMGSPDIENDRAHDEGPQRLVSIRSFQIAKYDVTRDEWEGFVAATGRVMPPNDCYVWTGSGWDRHGSELRPGFSQSGRDPVVCVSWNDAQDYLHWLSTVTGKTYRLPSEAEWEYAARAGTSTPYYWGNEFDFTRAVNNHSHTEPVGALPPNAYGLYDMTGNVWQWVEDCYHESYADGPVDGSAWTSGNCVRRVYRGGSWDAMSKLLRVSTRRGEDIPTRGNYRGFRLARSPEP